LLIQYFPGCNQTGVAQLRETADAVVLRVVRHGPRSRLLCLTMRVETVPLAAPLGKRRLIHAASS
jgi:hypothetical protein